MPAPLYARYVPSKKVEKSNPQPQITPVEEGIVQTNSLYARYVPPKRSNGPVKSIEPEVAAAQNGIYPRQESPASKDKSESKSKKRKREGQVIKDGGELKSKGRKHKTRVVEVVENKAEYTVPSVRSEVEDGYGSTERQTSETVVENKISGPSILQTGQDGSDDQEAANGDVDVGSIFVKYSVSGDAQHPSEDVGGQRNIAITEEEDVEDDALAAAGAQAVFAKYRRALTLSQKRQKKTANEDESGDKDSPEPELHDLVPLPQPAKAPRVLYKATFASLPSWILNPHAVKPEATIPFHDLALSKRLSENLTRRGLTNATAVQTGVLPLLLPGLENYLGDICVSAPTGSGKTLAYVLPMIENMQDLAMTCLRGLIVVPTRELVVQAREIAEMCAAGTGVKIGTGVGSTALAAEQALLVSKSQRYDPVAAKRLQQEAEEKVQLGCDMNDSFLDSMISLLPDHVPEYHSKVDILICTPGRLVDHIRSTPGFSLRDVEWLVIDEADRLIDSNFQDWVDVVLPALGSASLDDRISARERILSTLKEPADAKRIQKVILSATMTRDLSKLASLRLNRPTLVAVVDSEERTQDGGEVSKTDGQGAILPATLSESAIPVGDGSEKPIFLLHLLKEFLNISQRHDDSDVSSNKSNVLVFTRSDDNATRLRHILALMHPPFAEITATLTKGSLVKETSRTLNSFRSGKTRILISTDRASRGLDVENMTYVVNYDVPSSVTAYVHRVGRTARAGAQGMAWTLYTDPEARWFWKTICDGGEIKRGGRMVDRVRFREGEIGEGTRRAYQEALKQLRGAVHGKGGD